MHAHLDKVLIAPLCREGSFSPGVVHSQKRQMVPNIPPVEILVSIVSKDCLVLGSVEDAAAGTHHGCYGHNLLRALQQCA